MPLLELSSTAIILFGSILGCLVMLLIISLSISRKLSRLQHEIASLIPIPATDQLPTSTNPSPNSFDAFLSEDPQRAKLPKQDQFAAYRKWRQDKGLNWQSS